MSASEETERKNNDMEQKHEVFAGSQISRTLELLK